MADGSVFYVNGQRLLVKDAQARATGEAALEMASLVRAQSIDQFKGRSLAVQFATEILEFDNEWEWLKDRAARGDFDGLMIGDYLDVTPSSGVQMRYRIAAIDPYYRVRDTPMGHHVAMVPDETVPVTGSYAVNGDHIKWNDANTNNGIASETSPYINSNLHKWEEGVFLPSLPAIVRNCILERRFLLETRYSASGAQSNPNSWAWKSAKIWSPSEVEVYGHPVWGTNGYQQASDCHFPLFAQWKDRIRDAGNGSRVGWWLRVPAAGSSIWVCHVTSNGAATYADAAHTGIRPLPCFLIG